MKPCCRRAVVFMAADYTESHRVRRAFADDRRRLRDERWFQPHGYVNAAQRSARPLASREATRGRPV